MPSDLDRDVIKTYLKTDKKVMAGKVFYILPTAIGDTIITDDISIAELDEVLLSSETAGIGDELPAVIK